jgi:F420-non-reducing hydrogenase small subunit
MAHLLRRKSQYMIAYGACAATGGIPGLANQFPLQQLLKFVYEDGPSDANPEKTYPQTSHDDGGRRVTLPQLHEVVRTLDQVVDVDYYIPGCPPQPDQVKAALLAVVKGELPAKGSVVGAFDHALCEDCPRTRNEKKITRFYRPWEIMADPETCLLEQGILCAGVATRSGCGVRCPTSGIPCRGCYGPAPGVIDQGAKLASAVASIVDSKDPDEIQQILGGLPDFTSFAYRYGVASSLLQRSFRP